jgi:DNA repair protein RecO (recombination protein O)
VGGALEPIHTIAVLLEDRGGELATLKEARVVTPRLGVAGNLETLEAAGTALRWARHLFPPRTPEPAGWRVVIDLLDALERGESAPGKALAHAGLSLLGAVGYGLELDACVSCGRPCPRESPACIEPSRGGLVCRSCGGATTVLTANERLGALSIGAGHTEDATDAHAQVVLGIVDRALAAHAGLERAAR